MGFLTRSLVASDDDIMTVKSSTELLSSTSFVNAWETPSDVWVLLNPDHNSWTEEIDWALGMLLRRSLVRAEFKKNSRANSDLDTALLLATPEGMPAARVLVLPFVEDGDWLEKLGPMLTKMKTGIATVFAPKGWRPPQPKQIAEISRGEWGLRWVEPNI